jgi:hypothetical protein
VRLYVASSWRNPIQPSIVADLRAQGHDVYDFRHPPGGDHPEWTSWTPELPFSPMHEVMSRTGGHA